MARPRKLPAGMWQRGNTYYARFRAGGRLVRERLSSDFKAAVTMLNDLRARADRAESNFTSHAPRNLHQAVARHRHRPPGGTPTPS